MNYKKQVEAVLFTVGRFLTPEDIANILRIDPQIIKDALKEIKQEYSQKDSALEILEEDNKYRMHIKSEYLPLVKDLMPETELDRPTLLTLSVIAYKQPVLQSEVVKIRGNSTYDHVKILTDFGFITSDRSGVSRLIKLTPKFYDYFDTSREKIKQKLALPEPKQVDVLQELSKEDV